MEENTQEKLLNNEINEDTISNLNNEDNSENDNKQLKNKMYKRAVMGFIMGIAFYQVILFLVKML